ncbi:MAG: hypothetical protein ACT4PL_10620 [Phycisphaerales bacterium]
MGDPALIIVDGGLASLLAATVETMGRGPGGASGDDGPAPALYLALPPSLEAERPWRRRAAARIAEVCQIAEPIETAPLPPARTPGQATSALLLAAGAAAIERGLCRIVWPTVLGSSLGGDKEAVLNAVADATDRACAAARLVGLDGPEEGMVIQTPFVDFTREQLADLAADLDLPLGACWLGRPGSDEREALERALIAVGLEPPPSGTPSRAGVESALAYGKNA